MIDEIAEYFAGKSNLEKGASYIRNGNLLLLDTLLLFIGFAYLDISPKLKMRGSFAMLMRNFGVLQL